MKMKWIVLILVLACSAVFAASPAFNRWEQRYSNSIRFGEPQPKEYEKLIADLEQGVKELKAERDVLLKSRESTAFVSVAALRATGYELGCLIKPVDNAPGDWVYMISSNEIIDSVFQQWITKAREWDEKHEDDLISRLDATDDRRLYYRDIEAK